MSLFQDPNPAALRALLAAAATLAALWVGAVAIDGASASSGGVGSGGATAAEDDAGSAGGDRNARRFDRFWSQTSSGERRWAQRTAECESGGDPKAIGGGGMYRGAFQFMRSTWRNAPKSPGGDPIAYPYRTQAVVAIHLKRRDGAGHWPNCG